MIGKPRDGDEDEPLADLTEQRNHIPQRPSIDPGADASGSFFALSWFTPAGEKMPRAVRRTKRFASWPELGPASKIKTRSQVQGDWFRV